MAVDILEPLGSSSAPVGDYNCPAPTGRPTGASPLPGQTASRNQREGDNVKTMTTHRNRKRILIVEDNPHIQLLLRHLLRPWFDLDLAVNVDEALHIAAKNPFDLFLIDINLGAGRTGVDLLWALRQMPSYRATPAVSCTAYALRGDRERFLAYGFDEHIDKPFVPHQLHAMLSAALSSDNPRPAA